MCVVCVYIFVYLCTSLCVQQPRAIYAQLPKYLTFISFHEMKQLGQKVASCLQLVGAKESLFPRVCVCVFGFGSDT